jgi:hypothetical protein
MSEITDYWSKKLNRQANFDPDSEIDGSEGSDNSSLSMSRRNSSEAKERIFFEEKVEDLFWMLLDAQKDSVNWYHGCNSRLLLNSHRLIEQRVWDVRDVLRIRLDEELVDVHCKVEFVQTFNLRPLSKLRSLKTDGILCVFSEDMAKRSTVVIGDNKVCYTLLLPCIIHIKAVRSSNEAIIFKKFLRSCVNISHFITRPNVFFQHLESAKDIEGYNIYNFLVTEGNWAMCMNDLDFIHRKVFRDHQALKMPLAGNCQGSSSFRALICLACRPRMSK